MLQEKPDLIELFNANDEAGEKFLMERHILFKITN